MAIEASLVQEEPDACAQAAPRRVWSRHSQPAAAPRSAEGSRVTAPVATAVRRVWGRKPDQEPVVSMKQGQPSSTAAEESTTDDLSASPPCESVQEDASAGGTDAEVLQSGDVPADSHGAAVPGTAFAVKDEDDNATEKPRRPRRLRPSRDMYVTREREVEEVVDPEEDKSTTKKELLRNAIEWCKQLLPKEVEQKTKVEGRDYDGPGGGFFLERKELRMEVFYTEPALKKVTKKPRVHKPREIIKHTAETLHVFEYLKVQAPMVIADVAPVLKLLQRRAEYDGIEGNVPAAAEVEEALQTEIEDVPAEAPSALQSGPDPKCCNHEGPVAPLQTKFDALARKACTSKSCHFAINRFRNRLEEFGRSVEPYFVNVFSQILTAAGNPELGVTTQATELMELFISIMSPYAADLLIPSILAGIAKKAKPSLKIVSLGILETLANQFADFVGYKLVDLVAPVADLTCDAKKEVRSAAVQCMTAICACTGNKDLEPFLPFVVEAAQSISNTRACVEQLAGCIFVQNVEAPALAATLPVLCRGLNDRSEEIVRTCCQIVDNMCKLVEDPAEVVPLLPQLEPLVQSAAQRVADPEARSIVEKALATLHKVASKGALGSTQMTRERALEVVQAVLKEKRRKPIPREVLLHVAGLVAMATNMRRFDSEEWQSNVGFFPSFRSAANDIRHRMEASSMPEEEVEDEEEDGMDLYKGSFSLAYGTLTLLRDARMHLKRNRFYGLLGPNQCGKTTLMRAIANEQLEGFPKRDELKSVFVEHEIQDEEVGVEDDGFPIMSVDKPGWWWVMHTCNDVYKLEVQVSEKQVKDLMIEIGFGYPGGPERAANLELPVTTYSGGWKMKMQLCAAKLMQADVLMLDEPTGHLDQDNIRWLETWLEEFPGSVLCVSHFSPFLDRMCTHIIDFQDRKLKAFKGVKGSTLTKFVEKYPEKKAYFELSNDTMRFTFSMPGPLAGVKSRSKTILRMSGVTYTYATKTEPTIKEVNLTVSQVSRVAVIGANGAGKTTAIKILMGELVPSEGSIWKAPGLRLAYVAQHALHHLEKHMHETPTQYIMWRFAGDEDKEGLEFKCDDLNTDEAEARAKSWCIDGSTGVVRLCHTAEEDEKKAKQDLNNIVVPDALLNRRQRKRDKMYEYEVKWEFKPVDASCWVERDTLIKMGYLKFVQREDEKQAAMSGLMTKQLTQPCIEKHLRDFGVDSESASHTLISQLSGGLKVKVVLAAAMWQNPHALVLDEPTNYLDREGLGALALAIRDYQGGIVVISHNKEFCDSVATEKWIMSKGQLRIEGESVDTGEPMANAQGRVDEIIDGAGNKIAIKGVAHLTEKEKKREIKESESKLKDKQITLTDEERWELQDKILELKESLDDA